MGKEVLNSHKAAHGVSITIQPMTSVAEEKYDAIIVGAGFGGVYHLIRPRNLGLKCKLIEAGSDFGGTWYWNRYPGARVDSDIPVYEFSLPELWKEWTWTERFPGQKEIQAYFTYVDNKLHLRKDCQFNSLVKQAYWNDLKHIWHITSQGKECTYKAAAPYLILCMGSKPYTPKFKGLETFQGVCAHTSRWPKEEIRTSGRRVGVIGTGSSGVQVIQEIGKQVGHLTVFQRTPNLALPMGQCHVDTKVQRVFKEIYNEIYQKISNTAAGFAFDTLKRPMVQDSKQEIEVTLQALWDKGGFHYWFANYQDLFVNKSTNDAAYAFWQKNVSKRVKDPKKRELLAPTVAPHPFGCKRPGLEEYYYEIFNQDNVDLVDINMNPIIEVTPKGIKTAEKEYEFDVLVLATGFDTNIGAIMDMDLRGVNGKSIQDHWRHGTITYLGMTVDHFPNMFFSYGPQAPTSFANGPTCVELQGGWVVQTIGYLRRHGITKFVPTSRAALAYKKHINMMYDATLFPIAKSWYNGDNIPGKIREAYNYVGGVSNYKREIMEEMERGYPGFQRDALVSYRL